MNIVVLLKQVPDTETKIRIKNGEKKIDEEGVNWIVNPYDEYAVEEALRIKAAQGGTVTIVSLGPQKAQEAIRTALAMGADKAVHLQDAAFDGSDNYVVSLALSKAIAKLEYDVILCGKQAIDDDGAQVGSRVAELLGIPQISIVVKLEISGKTAKATRQIEGALQVIETSLPALITCQKGLNEPRYPTLPGIMQAKKKPLTVYTSADLGLDASQVGEAGSKLKIVDMYLPPTRSTGKKLEGEPQDVALQLARHLREEAKVI